MFFVLTNKSSTNIDEVNYKKAAEFEVNVVELVLYIITIVSIIVAMVQMKDLKYEKKFLGK